MTIKPNTSQRDLVRLAVLMCGDRPGAKYSRPVKGTQNAATKTRRAASRANALEGHRAASWRRCPPLRDFLPHGGLPGTSLGGVVALSAALQQRGQFALARGGNPVRASRACSGCSRCPSGCSGRWSCFARLRDAGRGAGSRQARRRPAADGDDHRLGAAAGALAHRPAASCGGRCWGPASSWSGWRCSCWSVIPTPASTTHRREGLVIATVVISAIVVVLLLWLRTQVRRRRCAPRSSASARACSSGCRPASPSRSSTTSMSASARPRETGGRGRCSGSGSSRSSSSSCRWRPASWRRRWRQSRSRTPRSA